MPDSLRHCKADIFEALANSTRIAIPEPLTSGEKPAREIIEKLAMEQANFSQRLAAARARKIATNRKAGNQVFYSRDPIILRVLALMRQFFQNHLQESLAMLGETHRASAERPA